MSAPAGRPLSLARVKALPAGARVIDGFGSAWERHLSPSTGRPGWFYTHEVIRGTLSASPTSLWQHHSPLHLADAGEATP